MMIGGQPLIEKVKNLNRDFDQIAIRHFHGKLLEYGVIYGGAIVFLLKSGQNGSIYGHEHKYLKLGHTLKEKYGYTVVCASNPFDESDDLADAIDFINQLALSGMEQSKPEIHFWGISNGARLGAMFGGSYPQITKLMLVNMPLVMNWRKIKLGIQSLQLEQEAWFFMERKTRHTVTTKCYSAVNPHQFT